MSDTLLQFVRHDLMCTDVPVAARFYSALFGWTTTDVKVMGTTIVRLLAGERVLGGIIPFDRSLGHPSHWVPYVQVASVDDCCQRVRELGGRVCMGTTDFPPGTFAMVNDPQGAVFSPFTPKPDRPVDLPPRGAPGAFCWDEVMTTDVDGGRRFYQALFGWESADRGMAHGGTYTIFRLGEAMVAGMLVRPAHLDVPPHWLSYVAVADAAEALARAGELGATMLVPATGVPGFGTFAVFSDPTGAVIGILGK